LTAISAVIGIIIAYTKIDDADPMLRSSTRAPGCPDHPGGSVDASDIVTRFLTLGRCSILAYQA